MYFCIGLLLALFVAAVQSGKLNAVADKLHTSFADTFFVYLLPPIIFESGYSMEKKPFFANFWSICAFAFAGTLLSSIVIAVLIMVFVAGGMFPAFSWVDALLFGSVLSSTDPVTVLAVFQVTAVVGECRLQDELRHVVPVR